MKDFVRVGVSDAADQTWMGIMASEVDARTQEVWEAVRDARDAALDFLSARHAAGEDVMGLEVDDVSRAVISDRGNVLEAEALLREAVALFQEALPSDHWKVAEARVELAGALLRKERSSGPKRDEARQLLQSIEVDLERPGFDWVRSRVATFRAMARKEADFR